MTLPSEIHPDASAPNQPSPLATALADYDLSPTAAKELLTYAGATHTRQHNGPQARPLTATGHSDPFLLCNWLTDHALQQVPSLARRWQAFRRHFAGWLNGSSPTSVDLQWTSQRHLYLPPSKLGEPIQWSLPLPAETLHQQIDPHSHPALHTSTQVTRRFQARVQLHEQRVPSEIRNLYEHWCDSFHYGYRRHHPSDQPGQHATGSCLDAAMGLQKVLHQAGYPTILRGGILALGWLSNPHYWLEVAVENDRWAPLDPALPAIWRHTHANPSEIIAVLHRSCGSIDPHRIAVEPVSIPSPTDTNTSDNTAWCGIVGWPSLNGQSAWMCQDWVLGSCRDDAHAYKDSTKNA